jgi:hypothetical protein
MNNFNFSNAVTEKLGYYVYILKDPRDKTIFYIGKGTGNRVFNHIHRALESETISDKYSQINDIIRCGYHVEHYILRHNLTSDLAFEVESACIDLLGLDILTNEVAGHEAWERGLKTVDEIIQQYDAEEVKIMERAIIININKQYKRFMTDVELYNSTRHRWKVGKKRNEAAYAIASYRGLVREIYAIQGWRKCDDGRYEFYGQVAMPEIRSKYLNQSVQSYIKKGNQNPIKYTF